jgi:hypothetical protein
MFVWETIVDAAAFSKAPTCILCDIVANELALQLVGDISVEFY